MRPSVPTSQSASAAHTPLAEALVRHIRANGPITFADYMRECLYHPECGYYAQAAPHAVHDRDYYTSVDVHPVFGRLLARQLAEMWEALGRPAQFGVVEMGAGAGKLASQILDFSRSTLPDFYQAQRYMAIERSDARRGQQAALLGEHLNTGRAVSHAEMPEQSIPGCVLSNEFVDALPVHRVLQQEHGLQEVFVGVRGGELCDAPGPPSTPELAAYFERQAIRLQAWQRGEVNLAAEEWIRGVGRLLQRGFALTIDYGHPATELYNQRHMRGTLLAYHRHRAAEDFYARPGEQDLTAHVNFTALQQAGAGAGLETMGLVSQSHFLLALGRGNDFADLYDQGQSEAEKLKARLKLKTLIYPEGMGETFRVLVQKKNVEAAQLTGLKPL